MEGPTRAPTRPRPAFEVGRYRPPSEGGNHSLLIRVTRNCPWNRCTFCGMYKAERFTPRSTAEVVADIDKVAAICERLLTTSQRLGHGGRLTREVVVELLRSEPELGEVVGLDMVIDWLASGAQTVFLQDGDSLALRPDRLAEVLRHLTSTFPSIRRITSYARAKTLFKRDPDDLRTLREAGLTRLHVGLESGDDELLARIAKGVTGAEQIAAGRKAVAAGFELSEYWMPGLGGRERSAQHADNTARVVNEIAPHSLRSRPFFPWPGTPIAEEIERGEVHLLAPSEHLAEVRSLIQQLRFDGRVCFDHAGNYWRGPEGGPLLRLDYEGYTLPDERADLLARIEEGLEVLRPLGQDA